MKMKMKHAFVGYLSLVSIVAAPAFADATKKEPEKSAAVEPTEAPQADKPIATPGVSEPETKSEPVVKAEAAPEVDDTGYGKTRGLLGPVVLGPRVTLAALPRPFAIALEGKTLNNWIGFSVDYSFLPSFKVSDIALKFSSVDARARIFPFQGSFFLGAALGRQSFSGTMSKTISGVSAELTADVKTTYVSPMIGWRWVQKSGFFMGMELGYQKPLSYETVLTDSVTDATVQATADYKKMVKDVKDTGNTFGAFGLPVISLLQVGYLF